MQPEDSIERRVLISIRRIIRAVDVHSRRLLEEYGLTGPQLAALEEIDRARALPAGELARRLSVGQPTVTGILERLERRGLVARTRNGEDRRSVTVTITAEGRKLLETAPPMLQARFCQKLAKLEEWEQTMILATLQRIAAMMDADEIEASPHLVSGPDPL